MKLKEQKSNSKEFNDQQNTSSSSYMIKPTNIFNKTEKLKLLRDWAFFNSIGTISHIFGPRYEIHGKVFLQKVT